MESITYSWKSGDRRSVFDLVFVRGTHGQPYSFGERGGHLVGIQDFFIGTLPVTQALWSHVMGDESKPAVYQGADVPLENVSWDQITRPGGFLDCINPEARRSHAASGAEGAESARHL